jgi:hypothetical protein
MLSSIVARCSRFSIWIYCSMLIKQSINFASAIFFATIFSDRPGCVINGYAHSNLENETFFSICYLFLCKLSDLNWGASSPWTCGSLAWMFRRSNHSNRHRHHFAITIIVMSLIQYPFLASLLLVLEGGGVARGQRWAGGGSGGTARAAQEA